MTTAEQGTNAPTTVPFKAEVQQLLSILSASLYADREIFLRELISNSSDALRRVQFALLTDNTLIDPEAELEIRIAFDEEAKTVTITDTGIGMTEEEMVKNLGTIAQSGARAALEKLEQAQKHDIIGQFGVGFYSAFAVADRVAVVSRSAQPGSTAALWECTGGDTFTIAPAEREQRGTTVTLHLKEDAHEFANSWRLRQIIKKHSDFVAFPIFVGDEQVNQKTALWRRAPRDVTDEQYTEFYRQLTFDYQPPLKRLHISTDVPLDLHAILFIPATRERGMIERRVEGKIKLYSRNILIQEDAPELLPKHFRFIEGVVDSEDLPLNVSRETIQRGPQQKIAKLLNSRLIRELNDMAEKEPDQYRSFWHEFGPFLKEGLAVDPAVKDDLVKLLRFNSTAEPEALTSLAEYKSRAAEGQTELYYVLAGDLESARRSPHLDPFYERKLEVLLMHDVVDGFMLNGLTEFDGLKLRNVDDPELILPDTDETPATALNDQQWQLLADRFSAVLGDRITEVRQSRILKGSPARLLSPANGGNRNNERIQRLLDRDYTVQAKIIELNPAHPLIVSVAKLEEAQAQEALVAMTIEQIYASSLLLEGLHPNPADMVPRIQQLMEAALKPGA
ncbi:MAG: molecular chaperone HtpG [Herpetosiphon sp.]